MFETFKNLLVEELQLDADEIKMESELTNDLGINSIEQAELLEACAEKFEADLDDESEIPMLVTVGDVVEFLENYNK